MKIGLTTSEDTGWDAKLDSRFGRGEYLAIVDLDNEEVDFIENSAANSASGAGVELAQMVADQDVDSVILYRIGPKAFSGLDNAGISIYEAEGNKLSEVVDRYQAGELNQIEAPTNRGHIN
ncbi:MAG: NifB/NifX family molybdenum-iron cluster-binding protein [Bacillota bacterium]